MFISPNIVYSNRIEGEWDVLDVVGLVFVEKPWVVEPFPGQLVAEVWDCIPQDVPMPELSLVLSLELHSAPYPCCSIVVLCALLVADSMMSLVSVNFIPSSLKSIKVKVSYPWNFRAPSKLETSLSGCHESGCCNQSFHKNVKLIIIKTTAVCILIYLFISL